MDTVIPNAADPSPAIDKIESAFTILSTIGWEIPVKIQCMMLLAKAPPSMEAIVQMLCNVVLQDEKATAAMETEKVATAMRGSWETHARTGAHRGQNQQRANKLSAVKPANAQPPSFQQQQYRQQQQFRQQRRGYQGGR